MKFKILIFYSLCLATENYFHEDNEALPVHHPPRHPPKYAALDKSESPEDGSSYSQESQQFDGYGDPETLPIRPVKKPPHKVIENDLDGLDDGRIIKPYQNDMNRPSYVNNQQYPNRIDSEESQQHIKHKHGHDHPPLRTRKPPKEGRYVEDYDLFGTPPTPSFIAHIIYKYPIAHYILLGSFVLLCSILLIGVFVINVKIYRRIFKKKTNTEYFDTDKGRAGGVRRSAEIFFDSLDPCEPHVLDIDEKDTDFDYKNKTLT